MWMLRRSRVAALALVSFIPACSDSKQPLAPHHQDQVRPAPAFTVGSGLAATTLSRATFSDPTDPTFKVKRMTGDWHVEVKSRPALDLAIQSIVFQAGGQSGWHSHPGPAFVQVVSGTVTFYESDDPTCTGIVRTEGQEYLDVGGHAHLARNETDAPAQVIVAYFAPPGAALRVDEPNPGNCPF
jgi:quercetin dioxygenase-like cupin family protein